MSAAAGQSKGAPYRPATTPESGWSERRELHVRPEFDKPSCPTTVSPSMGASGRPEGPDGTGTQEARWRHHYTAPAGFQLAER